VPNQKVKTDHYSNFGGVNTKASKYLTGPNEVLASFNNDGSSVGDFTGRPGSTQYFSATFANTGIVGLSEYTKLNGYSKIMVAHPGGMWLGQDNSVVGISLGDLATAQTLAYNYFLLGVTHYITRPGVSFGPSQWDYATFVDHQFFCDGRAFLKFNGTTQTFWGLPDAVVPQNYGHSIVTLQFTTPPTASSGTSLGVFYFAFAYLNERGFLGPAKIFAGGVVQSSVPSLALAMRVTFPMTGFGITAMAVYSYFGGSASITDLDNLTAQSTESPPNGTTYGTNFGLGDGRVDERFRLLQFIPVGSTLFGPYVNPYNPNGDIPNNYSPFGATNYLTGFGNTNQIHNEFNLNPPRFTELFKNQLFWAGTTQLQSSVFFSDIGEPEGWNNEWEFEFRTNDGDKITALKTYGNRLMVGKELSLHELTGDDPETFNPREISTEYGILNNRACTSWEGRFWFLDHKGIAEYTGGLPKIISEKVESVFKRMNLSVAKNTAQMIYMKERSEVWTLIPIDNSTINNMLVVFDTVSNQWYFWDGPNISILAKMIGRNGKVTPFFGDYSNRVNTFGTSFFGDNGSGFTQLVQFRYENPMGNSVEKLFRKAFVDAESLAGNATLGIDIKLRANYGASYQVGTTMAFTSIQDELQFGIPARSLSVEISHFSAVDSIRLHGYALEHRWLRNS
jgi:hypothetical protein